MHEVTFPDIPTLRDRGTLKWTAYPDDVLPLWVAESDAATCPAVIDAVRAAVDREYFGYPRRSVADLAEATADWYADRYGWRPDADRIHPVADVVRGVTLAVRYLTRPDSPVVLPVPAYMPFFEVGPAADRELVHVPTLSDGPDPAAVEEAFRNGAGSLILCNPNNPLGFTFTADKLRELADIAAKYDARIISDEIHAPVVLDGRHVPAASVSGTAERVTVTVTATSKGWNTAGLKCAQMILSESDDAAWRKLAHVIKEGVSTLGMVAATAVAVGGGPWLDNFNDVLRANLDTLERRLPEVAPGAVLRRPEASYLAWIDFRGVDGVGGVGDGSGEPMEPQKWLLENAKVALNPGPAFGEGGAGHVRLNFGTSPEILDAALDRIGAAVAGDR
ncbi:MalY/PatB family protein [uncultured Corynebacterium sp.]|uniref:MalY/PatB family protein n=1 Tax=uncultured Corynebacterium sp. TaxID=159447 RepID=UPI002608F5CA|nr:aminotransferase class I/II-fold pyridoxal phosphate-dependent enzyme [uncultured Corynebacterium sp.]